MNRDIVVDAFFKTENRMPLPTEINSAAATLWNALDDLEKFPYRDLAKRERLQFYRTHPGYKFKRRSTEEIRRRMSASKIIF
jgi:hypothetical protein